MWGFLDPKPGETVYDPACGSGGMLIEAVHHMKNDERCCGAIFGQEKNVTNALLTILSSNLHPELQTTSLSKKSLFSIHQSGTIHILIPKPNFRSRTFL